MQINQASLRNVFRGLRVLFAQAYQGHTDDPIMKLAWRTTSTAAEEVYHWLGALPGMKKLIDEIKIENVKAHNYTIPNDEWESTVAVKLADIERDRLGVYTPLIQSMGVVARQHDAEQVAQLLVSGFSRKCYTGKNFFDTDHEPIPKGTKFSNKMTKKLSAANFETARAALRSRKNAAGRVMGLGRDLVLLVGPKNETLGLEILKAERSANGATNVNKGTSRLEVSAEIGGQNEDAWFLGDFAHPMKPLIVQDEQAVQLLALDDPAGEHAFKKKEFLYQAYKRAGYGYGLPELIQGSDGSAPA